MGYVSLHSSASLPASPAKGVPSAPLPVSQPQPQAQPVSTAEPAAQQPQIQLAPHVSTHPPPYKEKDY